MADTKLTALGAVTPISTDILYIVDDPGGTPVSGKVTVSGLLALAPQGTVTSVAVSGSDGLEVDSGSPITASGTIALGVNAATMRAHLDLEVGTDVQAVDVARLGASTYSTVQHMQDIFHSAGVASGGAITDDGDGTITVTAGAGLIRASTVETSLLYWTDWNGEAGVNVNLADNDMNWVYVEYNAGTPRVVASITEPTQWQTNILLGTVYREGTVLHITEGVRALVGDHALRMIERLKATMPFARASGGNLAATGTLNFSVSAGNWWEGLTNFTTSAFDSAAADRFTYHYRNGSGGFTAVTNVAAINPQNYDNGTGTLAAAPVNDFKADWVYITQDDEIHVLYGRSVFNTLAEAQADGVPSTLPPSFDESHARLIGRIITQEGETAFAEIAGVFTNPLTAAVASDHGGLTGLGDNDHPQYLLVSGLGSVTQAYDAELAAIAGLTSAADKLPYFSGSGTAALADFTAFGRTLVAQASADFARTELAVRPGTDVQAYDADLAALAGLTSAADKVPYFTGSGTAAVADLPSFGRTLIANTLAADARTDLELVYASDAQVRAKTSALTVLSPDSFGALEFVTVTYGATVALDFGTFINARITMTGDLELTAPTNTIFASGIIALRQDGTGLHTLTATNAAYLWDAGTLITLDETANVETLIGYQVLATGQVFMKYIGKWTTV